MKSSDNSLVLSRDGEELFYASLTGPTGTLYHVQCAPLGSGTAYLVSSPLSMCLWHRRLGHLSLQTINSILCQQMVKGLDITAPQDFDHLCSGCANEKSHRLPFPEASQSKYSKMELIVMDLTGPMSVPTWDGFLYALVIIEVSCRYPVRRLLRNKDETGTAVCDILVMFERQSGQKICRLCSDNGSEFINQTMAEFCRRNGIVHETTIPYTPEQNGIAERAIAIFFEMVQSMLYMAGISLHYWGEAFTYAVHIWTLCSTTVLNSVVPYEAWTGHKPDVSHLRVFGSLGWAHIPKQVHKGKLESQAVKVRMLGWWVDESKGYCLEDLENSKLIAS